MGTGTPGPGLVVLGSSMSTRFPLAVPDKHSKEGPYGIRTHPCKSAAPFSRDVGAPVRAPCEHGPQRRARLGTTCATAARKGIATMLLAELRAAGDASPFGRWP